MFFSEKFKIYFFENFFRAKAWDEVFKLYSNYTVECFVTLKGIEVVFKVYEGGCVERGDPVNLVPTIIISLLID